MGEEPELIARKVLFGNPERTSVRLSHDGAHISYLAPVDGVMNVWVAPVDAIEEARPVTADTGRGIRIYFWTYNPSYIMYLQDREGDENWHAHVVNVETGESRDLTPFEGVQAVPQPPSPKYPDEVLIGINRRDAQLHDLYRVNFVTGESELIVKNDFGAVYILPDWDFRPRLSVLLTPSGGAEVLSLSESGEWQTMMRIDAEDDMTTFLQYFDEEGRTLYMYDSRGRDTSALVAVDTETGDSEELAINERTDAVDTIMHPVTCRPQAVSFEYERVNWEVLDESIRHDIERIDDQSKGQFEVRSRSSDDSKWLIEYVRDDGPKTFFCIGGRQGRWSTCSRTDRSSRRRRLHGCTRRL